jgi:DNA-binding NarL/FixJ family response regulator
MDGIRELEEQVGTRVLVMHPQTLLRQGMVQLINNLDGFAVVASAGSAIESIQLGEATEPDLILLDADAPDVDTADIVQTLRGVAPSARICVLAEQADPHGVERALAAGADGFTLKEISADELTDTLRRLADMRRPGDVYVHPLAATALIRALGVGTGTKGNEPLPLTDRQLEIVRLLAEGLQNKQIARRLDIGVHTVKTHVSRILEKLDAHSRTEAAVIAARKGLIAL